MIDDRAVNGGGGASGGDDGGVFVEYGSGDVQLIGGGVDDAAGKTGAPAVSELFGDVRVFPEDGIGDVKIDFRIGPDGRASRFKPAP